MLINTDGLILMEMSISDNDKLVTVLTRKEGIIRAFVSGAKKIKNKNAVATQLLSYSKLIIYKGKDKYIINDAHTEELFFELRSDIEKLAIAQYFCELSIAIVPEENNSEDFLRLILNALYYLCKNKMDNRLIKAIVEMRLLSMAGYKPHLVCCNDCAKYEDEYMYFVIDNGTIYCKDCFNKNTYAGIKLSMGVLTALRHSIYCEFKNIFKFNLSEASKKLFSDVSERYVVSKIDKSFKSLDFYKQIRLD